jgi:hypothetical protein
MDQRADRNRIYSAGKWDGRSPRRHTDILALSHTFFGNDPITQLLNEAHDSSAGVVIALDANDSITLNHVTVAQLTQHPSDFHFFKKLMASQCVSELS